MLGLKFGQTLITNVPDFHKIASRLVILKVTKKFEANI